MCAYQWEQMGNTFDAYSMDGATSSANMDLVAVAKYDTITIYKWNGSSWTILGQQIIVSFYCSSLDGIDMSGDGNIIVTACSDQSMVLIYERTASNQWILEQAINFPGSTNPIRVAISKDGTTIAIGLPKELDPNGNETGKVVVYRKQGSSWQPVGNEIWGEGYKYKFGWSIDLDSAGNTIVVGAPGSFSYGDTADNKVFVFEFNNGYWVPKGDTLVMKPRTRFGYDVAINDAGDVIAASAPRYDFTFGFEGGIVKVFHFDSVNNRWELKGIPIYNPDIYWATTYYSGSFGHNIDLDHSGNRVIISEPGKLTIFRDTMVVYGKINVFEFNGDIDSVFWIRKGQVLYGYDLYFGTVLQMSSDGNKVLGFSSFSPDPPDKLGVVYRLQQGRWRIQPAYFYMGDSTYFLNNMPIVDISKDGKKCITVDKSQRAFAYEWSSGQWQIRGSMLDSGVNDITSNYYGNIVALSKYDKVIVLKWNGVKWDTIGSFNYSSYDVARIELSMNSQGDVLAVGLHRYTFYNEFAVVVYKFYNGTWHTLGDTIFNKGFRVALDSAGSILAITGNTFKELSVWKWDGLNWNMLGDPITFSEDMFYVSLSISGNGQRVAVGIPKRKLLGLQNVGIAYVFGWDGIHWHLVGSPLKGKERWEQFGIDVELDYDGDRVAIATGANHASRIYEWKDSMWLQIGEDITGYLDVEITPSGDKVAALICTYDGGQGWYKCRIAIHELAPELPDTLNITACNFYIPPSGNFVISSSGTYYDTVQVCALSNPIVINAQIYSDVLIDSVIIACDSALLPNGRVIKTSGLYIDSFATIHGCDSILRYHVLIDTGGIIDTFVESCDSFVSLAGQVWYNTGIYYDTLHLSAGCSPIIRYSLTIHPSSFVSQSAQACDSFVSPTGKIWYTSGIYYDTLGNTYMCDSVIEFNLTIYQSANVDMQVIACDSFVLPSGHTVYSSGVFTHGFQTIHGCDSVVHYQVTIVDNDPYIDMQGDTLIAMPQADSYQWFECTNNILVPLLEDTLPYFIPAQTGYYAVGVIDRGCVDTSDCYLIFVPVSGTSIPDIVKSILFSNNRIVVITFQTITDVILAVYDVYGRILILQPKKSGNRFLLDIQQLPAGSYILRLISKEVIYSQMFTKY